LEQIGSLAKATKRAAAPAQVMDLSDFSVRINAAAA